MNLPNTLSIQVVDSPEEAPQYSTDPDKTFRLVDLTKAIVVKEGTTAGLCTVDLQFQDQKGSQYVAMVTGTLLKSLVQAIEGAEALNDTMEDS